MEDRKRRILQAIVDDYVHTAEPVGSRTVARKYLPGVSPATIRNEMADLEEQGYLEQPHVSAGRIPADRGYRFYVDELMPRPELPLEVQQEMRRELGSAPDPDQLIYRAGRTLSRRTRYASLVLKPSLRRLTVRHVRFTPVDRAHVLLVVVADAGFVYNRLLQWSDATEQADVLERLSGVLTRALAGATARDLDRTLLEQLGDELPTRRLRELALTPLMELLGQGQEGEQAYLDGMPFLLEQPEFRDVERTRQVLDRLQEPQTLVEVMMGGDVGDVSVVIGREQPVSELQRCSVVLAPYGPGDRPVGVIGLIGPTRMDYRLTVAAVRAMAEMLSETLERLPGDN
ncbi:MAG TPA: heat-inducible transcriptional repressor HrcA [Limnochordales bacterium]